MAKITLASFYGDKQTWENDNGLVIRREPDGSVSFDIFDADEWNGGIEEGRTIAALIVLAVNHHEELVEALKNCRSLVQLKFGNTDPTANAAIAQADAVIAKVEASDA